MTAMSSAERQTAWRARNPIRRKMAGRRQLANLKDEVFAAYGGICKLCGFSDHRALSIDHVSQKCDHKKTNGKRWSSRKMYEWLRQQGFPKRQYRLLCMNCQFIVYHESRDEERQHG